MSLIIHQYSIWTWLPPPWTCGASTSTTGGSLGWVIIILYFYVYLYLLIIIISRWYVILFVFVFYISICTDRERRVWWWRAVEVQRHCSQCTYSPPLPTWHWYDCHLDFYDDDDGDDDYSSQDTSQRLLLGLVTPTLPHMHTLLLPNALYPRYRQKSKKSKNPKIIFF